MCEIALVSSRRARLSQLAKNGSKGAAMALELLKKPERFLSTIQIGITLVGIIAGAYGADAFAKDLQPVFEKSALLKPFAEKIAFTLIIVAITYFTLIIGELVPKTIAYSNPEKITITLAPVMKIIERMAMPLVLFLSFSTRIFQKIFFIKPVKNPPITEDELKYYIDTGARHGTIEKEEGEMLHSVFRFGDRTARDLMIFRKNVGWLNANQPKEKILDDIFQLPFTKYPVCNDNLDNILGVVMITDVLREIKKRDFDIRQHLKPAVIFAPDTAALRILEEFRRKKVHIGLVRGDGKSIEGLITVHDLVENIVGELPDSRTVFKTTVIKRPDGSVLASGGTPVGDVLAHFGKEVTPELHTVTMAAFVRKNCTELRAGVRFSQKSLTYEIMDMDGSKIDKVLVMKESGSKEAGAQ